MGDVNYSGLRRFTVCGIPIVATDVDTSAALVVQAARTHTTLEIHLCNAFTLSLVDTDQELASALRSAHVNLPDGAPVAWLGKRSGTTGPVRGQALTLRVARRGTAFGIKHYLYGGAAGVAGEVADALEVQAPGVQVVGQETPPYHVLNESELTLLAQRIQHAGADVLWIGLGTPKQDHLVARLGRHLSIPIVPIGAAFDFMSGRVSQAPERLHGSGLEWLYRFSREPRRLWRRYLVGNVVFVANVIRHSGFWARLRAMARR